MYLQRAGGICAREPARGRQPSTALPAEGGHSRRGTRRRLVAALRLRYESTFARGLRVAKHSTGRRIVKLP
jgi:hypothetical protein